MSLLYYSLLQIQQTTIVSGRLEDQVGVVLGHAVMGLQGVRQGALSTTLRGTSVRGQGVGNGDDQF